MARKYLREEGQAGFIPSTQSRIQLSRNYHMRYLVCKLAVEYSVNNPVWKSDDFANLINSIQIVGNGNKTIKHVDVKKLIANSIFDAGQRMRMIVKDLGGGNYKMKMWFTIDFAKRGMVRPNDTIENAALYNTFDMLIDWASAENVGTGIHVKNATLKVGSNQLVGYTRNPGERIAHNVETQLTEELTSVTSEHQINLPVNKIYQRLLIVTTVDGNRDTSILGKIKLKSGTTVFADVVAGNLNADNLDRYRVKQHDSINGMYLLDLVDRGRNSDALDTRKDFNTLELVLEVLNVPGTTKVTVYTDEFDVENTVEAKA